MGDTNPHIINFYNEIMNGEITPQNMRTYLEREGQLLLTAEVPEFSVCSLVSGSDAVAASSVFSGAGRAFSSAAMLSSERDAHGHKLVCAK